MKPLDFITDFAIKGAQMDILDERTKRAAEDAPNRCQAVTARGQCQLKAIDGSDYCIAHGGHTVAKKVEKENIRHYRLTKWRSRLDGFTDSPQIKSVREEIGILRLLLEERLNACTDTTELILHSQAISELVSKIERVVASCHKLESSMGQMMDKQAIIRFSGTVVEIISSVVNDLLSSSLIDEEIASLISSRIADALISNLNDLDPTSD